MARPLRILFKGAYYHVLNRGQGKRDIFLDKKDYNSFLKILEDTCQLYEVSIVAYCLMSNHYHLIVHTPKANLSDFMRQVNGVYTQIFNRCYKHDGPLFKGRYKSILIEADSYFMECVRYIHRNPIKVGLAGEVGEYRWTSHKCYVIKTNLQNWLCVEEALAYWGKHKKLAIKEYNDYVNQNVAEYLDKRLEGSN